jgi:NAD+ synthase (glutamine-hydrolysing)
MKTLMQKGLRIALAQMPVVAGNPRVNAAWMMNEIARAKTRGVDILIFPELCVPGYLIGDEAEDESFVRDVWYWNDRIVAATKGSEMVVIFGTYAIDREGALGEDGRLRKLNAGIVAQNGVVLRNRADLPFFVKTLMPKYRMFDDERHFLSLVKMAIERKELLEAILQPFDVTIHGEVLRLGAIICEDMWDQDYSVKPGKILAAHGIDLVVNLSCSPWGWQKNRARHQNVKRLAQDIGVPFIYVNNVMPQNNGKNFIIFDGATTVYNENGEVASYLKSFWVGVQDVVVSTGMPTVPYEEAPDIKQLYDGLVSGLQGYFLTIPARMRKVVIGLSGGVDSAVVAALIVKVLGKENVVGINMPYGDYNSAETRDAARELAENLGIEYLVMPIDDEVNLKAKRHGILPGTAQFKTLQAITRMDVLAAHATVIGGVYTCNGNKSETAFGFFTRDGDGRGSIAPIGDLLKGEVYQLAYHLNKVEYGREVIPQATIDVDPMDELGPQAVGALRKDPFDYGRVDAEGNLVRGYHDAWVHAVVGFRRNPEWFLVHYLTGDLEKQLLLPEGKVATLFPTAADFIADLERCWNLFWAAPQKRVQSVPNILVSKRAFGFDRRESVMAAYYTEGYLTLKSAALPQV